MTHSLVNVRGQREPGLPRGHLLTPAGPLKGAATGGDAWAVSLDAAPLGEGMTMESPW